MQDVSTACSIEIEQNVGRQASHAGGRWFDPSRAHPSPRSSAETGIAPWVTCATHAANAYSVHTRRKRLD